MRTWLLISAFICLSLAPSPASAWYGPTQVLPNTGDINNNGTYTQADIDCYVKAADAFAKNLPKPNCQVLSLENADMDCNGTIDTTDIDLATYRVKLTESSGNKNSLDYKKYLKLLKVVSSNSSLTHDNCYPPNPDHRINHLQVMTSLKFNKSEYPQLTSGIDIRKMSSWSDVEIAPLNCAQMNLNQLNFVFIPLGYEFGKPEAETIKDFAVYSGWAMRAMREYEPLKSYAKETKAWVYIPETFPKNFVAITNLPEADKTAQTDKNKAALTKQKYITTAELDIRCPNRNNPKETGGQYSSIIYVYVMNNTLTGPDYTEQKYYYLYGVGGQAFTEEGSIHMASFGVTAMTSPFWLDYFLNNYSLPVHELGHTYSGFMDEYEPYNIINPIDDNDFVANAALQTTVRYTSLKAPYCLSLPQATQVWGDLINTEKNKLAPENLKIGFFAGCQHWSNRYRSSKNSIMNGSASGFDEVQRKHMCTILKENTGKKLGSCAEFE